MMHSLKRSMYKTWRLAGKMRFVLASIPSLDKQLIDFAEMLFIRSSFGSLFFSSSAPYNPDRGCATSVFVSISRMHSTSLSLSISLSIFFSSVFRRNRTLVSRYEH